MTRLEGAIFDARNSYSTLYRLSLGAIPWPVEPEASRDSANRDFASSVGGAGSNSDIEPRDIVSSPGSPRAHHAHTEAHTEAHTDTIISDISTKLGLVMCTQGTSRKGGNARGRAIELKKVDPGDNGERLCVYLCDGLEIILPVKTSGHC